MHEFFFNPRKLLKVNNFYLFFNKFFIYIAIELKKKLILIFHIFIYLKIFNKKMFLTLKVNYKKNLIFRIKSL